MTRGSVLVVAPASEPVSIDEMREHLRLDTTVDDTYLSDLVMGAREYVEQEIRKALIEQTWALFLDAVPRFDNLGWWDGIRDGAISMKSPRFIELPISPLVSVDHIKYYDDEDNATTWAVSNYFVDTSSTPGRVGLRTGGTWPVFTRPLNGLEIQYKAGYGSLSSDVPSSLRQSVKIIAADWYENRETTQMGRISDKIEATVSYLLERYKVMRL